MSEKQRLEESLSALVDGEVSELELRRLLKADDKAFEELRSQWSRYHMASSSLKQELPNVDFCDLSGAIKEAIDEEPAHTAKTSKPKTGIWSGVGRFAIAASVAGAVVLGVQFTPNSDVSEQLVNVERLSPPASNGVFANPQTDIVTVSNSGNSESNESLKKPLNLTEETRKDLEKLESEANRLMLEHAHNASQNTQQGVLPFVRVPDSADQ